MAKLAAKLIEFYQRYLSGLKRARSCRFYPTCSEYTRQAFLRYGFLKGAWLGIIRVSKCHPFHPGGYDPLK